MPKDQASDMTQKEDKNDSLFDKALDVVEILTPSIVNNGLIDIINKVVDNKDDNDKAEGTDKKNEDENKAPSYHGGGGASFSSDVIGNSSAKENNEVSSPIYDIIENLYGEDFNALDYVDSYIKSLADPDPYDISNKLFNYPFHLMPSCDMQPESGKVALGRQFLEKISVPAKILYICPGVPLYMPGADKYTKNAITSLLSNKDGVSAGDLLTTNYSGKYFDFRCDYPNYMQYVNGLCRALAVLMGLGDEIGPDGKTHYRNYMWQTYRYTSRDTSVPSDSDGNAIFSTTPDLLDLSNLDIIMKEESEEDIDDEEDNDSELEEENPKFTVEFGPKVIFDDAKKYLNEVLFSDDQYTQFYLDNNSSFSEEFSNATMESTIKSKIDTASNALKEVAFLAQVGGVSSQKFTDTRDEAINKLTEYLDGDGEGSIFSRIFNGVSSILSGAQLIMPQLWESSSHSKSYSLTFFLYPPYGDDITVYEEVWVPLMHLLAYVLPRQAYKNPNSVVSPFLLRCFCKGQFSCQMGIVSSMVIDKSESVNPNGLPSRIKVTMYIKDLYDEMSMSPANRPGEFVSNQGLMDFLCNTAGMNLATPRVQTTAKLLTLFMKNNITGIPYNVCEKFLNKIRNSAKNITGAW